MNISLNKSRMLSVILIVVLLAASLPQAALSATTKEVTVTHYRLDTGVVFMWKNSAGAWQTVNGRTWTPGGTYTHDRSFSLPANAKNVKVSKYNGSNFTFGSGGYYEDASGTKAYNWNPTAYASDKDTYGNSYHNRSANIGSLSGADTYIPQNGGITVTYTATYSDGKKYDVKDMLQKGKGNEVLALLGGNVDPAITAFMEISDFSANVEGYLWFLPIVIQYDLTEQVEVADDILDAILELPKTARVDEAYAAKDISEIGGDLTVKNAELMKRVKGESTAWSPVVTWPGKCKGQNTGGREDEKANKPCEL